MVLYLVLSSDVDKAGYFIGAAFYMPVFSHFIA